jgi:hypothetical protein
MISYALSISASYLACLDLLVVTLSIMIACCSRLDPIYVIRVYDVNFV